MNDWPRLIRDLMKSERASQRQLEAVSGVARSTIKRALRGKTSIRADHLEDILASLGYSLVVQKTGEADPMVRRQPNRPREREGGPILSKLIKAAGMGVYY
jgi:transcriptional regulator with XRE-family HTH domain